MYFQLSKNDVINEEILTDCEKSIKWMPKPVTTPINKLPLVWNTAMNMASGGIVRIRARDVLTQNDFIIISGAIELFLSLTNLIFILRGWLFIEYAFLWCSRNININIYTRLCAYVSKHATNSYDGIYWLKFFTLVGLYVKINIGSLTIWVVLWQFINKYAVFLIIYA